MDSFSARGQVNIHEIYNTMVYNPQYDEALWMGLSYRSGSMCDIIKNAKALGLDLPPSPRDALKEACPYYHIKLFVNA